MVRILLVLLLSGVVVLAQDQPTPTPAPESTPAAAPEPSATATPDATPASITGAPPAPALDAATPAAPVEPAASPTPAGDVIPMEGQPAPAPPPPLPPSEGVPLETQDLSPPLPSGSVPDAAFTDPNAIVPDAAPLPPAMPQAAESAQEKARLQNIRYREVRVTADKDPQILRMLERSNLAKTDEDKRAALREYYRMLFAKMISIDKSLEAKCRLMEAAYIRRLAQDRLEPTIPLNPPPTPEPLTTR